MEELEKKEYYEVNLPPYLQHDLDAMKEGKYPYVVCGVSYMVLLIQHMWMESYQKTMHGI